MDASIIIISLLSFAVAVGFGIIVRRRNWPWLPLLVVAPFVAAVGVFLLFYVLTIILLAQAPTPTRNTNPIYLRALAGNLLLAPGYLIYGLIPSLLGYLLSQLRV